MWILNHVFLINILYQYIGSKTVSYICVSVLCNAPPSGRPHECPKHVEGIRCVQYAFIHLCAFAGFHFISNFIRISVNRQNTGTLVTTLECWALAYTMYLMLYCLSLPPYTSTGTQNYKCVCVCVCVCVY